MNKLIFLAVFVLFFVSSSSAIEVHIYDNESFEVDVFDVGQEVVIQAVSDSLPSIIIAEQKVYKAEMSFLNSSIYEYRLVPQKQGTYNVNVISGQESVDIQFFVESGLDIDWDQVEDDFIVKKEGIDTADTSVQNGSVKVEISMGESFSSKFLAWLKKGIGDRCE